MTPEEIMRYVLPPVIDKIKNPEKENKHDTMDSVPRYYENYQKIVTDYNNIRVHAVKHVFPARLFAERSPNQSPEEWSYVRKNFRKVTMPVFVDFINLISRAFFDQNYQIDYSNQPDGSPENEDSLEFYLKNGICEFGSIDKWLKSLPSVKIIDAMGVIAVRPETPKMRIIEGEEVIDDRELPEPQPYYYSCDKIVSYLEDEYYLILTDRRSPVKVGQRTEYSGLVFELYDEENIYFIEQVGKKTDFQFNITLFFKHELGYPPVKRLDGVTVIEDGRPYKQSPFLYSVDNLDLVLLNATNLQLACNNSVYPIKVMVGNPCTFTTTDGLKCNNGVILDPAKQSRTSCPSCQGSGLQQRTSPIGVYLLRPGNANSTDPENPYTAIRFVSPEVTTLDFLVKRINEDETRARAILHLPNAQEASAGENVVESGSKAKAITAFIKPISDQIFDMLYFVVDCIRKQRYGIESNYPVPEIMRPNSFDLLTHQDYLNEISEAIKNKLPGVVVTAAIDRYISSLYRNEKDKLRVYNLLFDADRFIMNTEDEISAKVSSRAADMWEWVLHDSGLMLITELVNEQPGFWDKDLKTQKELLVNKAKERALALPQAPKVPTFGDTE